MSERDDRHEILPGSVGVATVRGIPGVVVLRRQTSVGRDWAHDMIGRYTCSHDDDVTDLTRTLTPYGLKRALALPGEEEA